MRARSLLISIGKTKVKTKRMESCLLIVLFKSICQWLFWGRMSVGIAVARAFITFIDLKCDVILNIIKHYGHPKDLID